NISRFARRESCRGKLAGVELGLARGGPRVSRLSETGSNNDDSEGQSGDKRLHDTPPAIVHQRGRPAAPVSPMGPHDLPNGVRATAAGRLMPKMSIDLCHCRRVGPGKRSPYLKIAEHLAGAHNHCRHFLLALTMKPGSTGLRT